MRLSETRRALTPATPIAMGEGLAASLGVGPLSGAPAAAAASPLLNNVGWLDSQDDPLLALGRGGHFLYRRSLETPILAVAPSADASRIIAASANHVTVLDAATGDVQATSVLTPPRLAHGSVPLPPR